MIPQTYLFIGRSGAGKGTQAALLTEYLKANDTNNLPVFYVETGAHFREFIQQNGYANELAQEILKKGERQPDFLAIWNWADIIIKDLKEEMHLIMDGTPRSLPEAEILDSAFTFFRRLHPYIIYMNASTDASIGRLNSRGRSDDALSDNIANKMKWYAEDVAPAVEHFKDHSGYKFIEINADQTIEKVHADIIQRITEPTL